VDYEMDKSAKTAYGNKLWRKSKMNPLKYKQIPQNENLANLLYPEIFYAIT
jgi:hypothetical protein